MYYEGHPVLSNNTMKKFDYSAIDGRLLETFLAVLRECSVSAAARQLGVSQSAVSHSLARLREFFADPLFIRSGQRLAATELASSLETPVQAALDGIRALQNHRQFSAENESMKFVVAANDIQRDLIFPQLMREIYAEGLDVTFQFIPSGHPTPAMLRDDRCHLALTPFPPDGPDIVQKRILSGRMMCFFDQAIRDAPSDWKAYCEAEHVTVRFPDGGTSRRALTGVNAEEIGPARISVPNFNALPPFIRGTDLIATEVDLMSLVTLKGLAMSPLPADSDPVFIYMVWHRRSTGDPAHLWLRNRVGLISEQIQVGERHPDLD